MTQINGVNGQNPIMLDGVDMKQMSPFAAAALVQLEIAKTNKDTATRYISEMKAQNDRAKELMAAADKLRMLKEDKTIGDYNIPTNIEAMKKDLETVTKAEATYNKMLGDIKSGDLKPYINSRKDACFNLPNDTYNDLKTMTNRVGTKNFPDMTRGNDNVHQEYELKGGLKELEKYKSVLTAAIAAMETGGLSGFNGKLDSAKIDNLITTLQHQAENCNSDNQTQMVKLQDKMGQYNSYVSGSSDMIKTGAQLQQSILKS